MPLGFIFNRIPNLSLKVKLFICVLGSFSVSGGWGFWGDVAGGDAEGEFFYGEVFEAGICDLKREVGFFSPLNDGFGEVLVRAELSGDKSGEEGKDFCEIE